MRTILLPILSIIFSLTTLLSIERVSAFPKCAYMQLKPLSCTSQRAKIASQIEINHCRQQDNYSTKLNVCHKNSHSLTPQKWRRLLKKYYRTRYRTQFKENNDFLSLKEVNNLLGFSGTRNKVTKENSHQYLFWQDPENPRKRIEAVFIYNRLVGLRSRGFDRAYARQLKTQTSTPGDL